MKTKATESKLLKQAERNGNTFSVIFSFRDFTADEISEPGHLYADHSIFYKMNTNYEMHYDMKPFRKTVVTTGERDLNACEKMLRKGIINYEGYCLVEDNKFESQAKLYFSLKWKWIT